MSSKYTRIAASILMSRITPPQSGRTGSCSTNRAFNPNAIIEPHAGEDTSRLIFVRAHYRRRKGAA
jgi:hypothetical protein